MAFNIKLTEVGVNTCALKLAYLKTIRAIFKIIELVNLQQTFCTIFFSISSNI